MADGIIYVSLPSGTVPGGRSAAIRNLTNGFAATTDVVDGGFDPVPLVAGVGDSVEVVITDGSGGTTRAALRVPARRPPVIVRTVPPKGGTDVPLNSLIRVVFSEPMDSGTITTETVRLIRNGTPVAGRVVLAADGLRADFVPDALLDRATVYTLAVESGVADLSGDVLGQNVAADFTTGNQTGASPVSSVTITPGNADLVAFVGDTQPVFPGMVFMSPGIVSLTATARDSSGAPVTSNTAVWTNSSPSVTRLDTTRLVTAEPAGATASVQVLAPGRATITATVDGVAGTAVITVLTATVAPAAATLRVGETVRAVATVKDSAGRVQTGWTAYWSSRRNAVDVGSNSGLVTALAPGVELVTVTFQYPALFGIGVGGSAFARITVGSGGPLSSVVVEPDTVRTVPIGRVLLRATVRDANGANTYAPVSWSIAPQQCGQFNCNSVEPDGNVWNEAWVQMNDQAGTYTVTATAGGRSDTTTVISDYITVAAVSEGSDGGLYGGACVLTPNGEAYCVGPHGASGYGMVHFGYVGPVAVTGGLNFSAISSGVSHRCALTAAGVAYCWGANSYGQLGTVASLQDCNPDPRIGLDCSPSPVPVAGGFNFARITTAYSHTCALTTAGAAYCWGENDAGQLGDGTTISRSTPVAVAGGLSFTEVSTSVGHTCALTGAGLAYCWGNNGAGELGNGSTTSSSTPVAVTGGLTFSRIAAGSGYAGWGNTCAITATGVTYCWGNRYSLANASSANSPVPVPVAPGLTFTELGGAGGRCGLTAGGAVYCWGAYYANYSDDNDTLITVGPSLLGGGLAFASLSPGGDWAYVSCGITTGGVAYCWASVGYGPFRGEPRKLWGQR
ncbi:MAG: Ig-like domain-containing protein [Gemmatimonadales bacterium]|nr:Ig-like domain-containing protein [Gemmatimonadales bacterium]